MPTELNPDFPVVARFEIHRRRYIDEEGALVRPLPAALSEPRSIIRLYRAMILARTLDAKCVALNRQGRLGTYATAYGQEAVPIGVASAMRASDILVPSYRENAALLWRGVGIHEVLSYYAGSERGSDWAGPAHDFPTSITVGGHALHAAGAAFAVRYRGEARAVACVFGDAATLEGRCVRGVQPRRSVAPAGGVRHHQQPVGNLDPARKADRERDARAEGTGGRDSRSSRPTATTWSRCTRRCASDSNGHARAAARRSLRR